MKSIFILYMPGHAGNFLTRLFSLSPETFPQLPIPMLKDLAKNFKPLPQVDRLALYSFSTVLKEFENWQDFHRHWPDFKEHMYFKILNATTGLKYSVLVHSIHPHEFIKFEPDPYIEPSFKPKFESDEPNFGLLDQAEYYYSDLDLDKYGHWVNREQERLGFKNRDNEEDQFTEIVNRRNMKPISLTKMLDSDESFLEEYKNVCITMKITPVEQDALTLYYDWKKARIA